jgi:hypothetical protein
MAYADKNIINTCIRMIAERPTGILTTQLTREWEMLNGTENITRPWLNKPINRKKAIAINKLIKTTERLGPEKMDTVIEKTTGTPKKIWSITNNIHIPSRYWSYVGIRRKNRTPKGKEKENPGPHTNFKTSEQPHVHRTDEQNTRNRQKIWKNKQEEDRQRKSRSRKGNGKTNNV